MKTADSKALQAGRIDQQHAVDESDSSKTVQVKEIGPEQGQRSRESSKPKEESEESGSDSQSASAGKEKE